MIKTYQNIVAGLLIEITLRPPLRFLAPPRQKRTTNLQQHNPIIRLYKTPLRGDLLVTHVYTVLYYTCLYYIILYHNIIYHIIIYYIILYYILYLYYNYNVLYYIILYYIVCTIYCIIYYILLYYIIL